MLLIFQTRFWPILYMYMYILSDCVQNEKYLGNEGSETTSRIISQYILEKKETQSSLVFFQQ